MTQDALEQVIAIAERTNDVQAFHALQSQDGKRLDNSRAVEIFVSVVARNRGTTVTNVKQNYGNGGVMLAEQALRVGMIDGLEDLARRGGFRVRLQ